MESGAWRYQERGGGLKTWVISLFVVLSAPCIEERSRAQKTGQEKGEVCTVPLVVSNQVGVRMVRGRLQTWLSSSLLPAFVPSFFLAYLHHSTLQNTWSGLSEGEVTWPVMQPFGAGDWNYF